ncbi:FAD-binding oxidoreductase [Micrococcus luteus]|uniref:FAD-binding oxidoreductase n=1 Tax=Micrococcus luteus TaxID=1270 RepID=UPI0033CCF8FA
METYLPPLATRLDDDLDRLDAAMTGRLVRPGSTDWHRARQTWNLSADLRPVAVAEVASVYDVVEVVGTARLAGLRVAPMSTGHNAGPLPDLDGVILLKLGALRDVTIDATAETARVGGGALWSDVVDVAARHGLATLAGMSRDVGVVGYLLGGGMSWFVRTHGPASDYVTAIEVVTADGQLRRVDASTESDLFWALCGGGGSFGVVTAIEFKLLPISSVQGGKLVWPGNVAWQVLHEWRMWIATAPEEITSTCRLLNFPPLPTLPGAVRGKAFVEIEIVSQLNAEGTDEVLSQLRALTPSMDTVTEMPVSRLWQIHGAPDSRVSCMGASMLLNDLPAEAIDAMLASSGLPLVSLELRHLGGAFTSRRGGAVAFADAEIAAIATVVVPMPRDRELCTGQVRAALAGLGEWATGQAYLNLAESPAPIEDFFGKDVLDRLRAVRATYDPDNLILANHNVDPA